MVQWLRECIVLSEEPSLVSSTHAGYLEPPVTPAPKYLHRHLHLHAHMHTKIHVIKIFRELLFISA